MQAGWTSPVWRKINDIPWLEYRLFRWVFNASKFSERAMATQELTTRKSVTAMARSLERVFRRCGWSVLRLG